MAEVLAKHRFSSREAGQLYAAWREAAPAIRQRILQEPQLFLKAQRQREADPPPADGVAALMRDLDIAVAIIRRANRRLAGATVEVDGPQSRQLHHKIERAQHELSRLTNKLPSPQAQEQAHVESKSTDHDFGTACPRSEQTRDCAGTEPQPGNGAQSPARQLDDSADLDTSGESRTLSPTDHGADRSLQGQSGAGAGGARGLRSPAVVLHPDRLLSPAWHQPSAGGASRTLRLSAGPRTAARHLAPRGVAGRQTTQGADRLGGAVLLAPVVLPDVSHLPALRLQGVSDRGAALLRGRSATHHDRQHPCGGAARQRARDGTSR